MCNQALPDPVVYAVLIVCGLAAAALVAVGVSMVIYARKGKL